MRTFDIPKIERKAPTVEVVSSGGFISQIGEPTKIHFSTSRGLTYVGPLRPKLTVSPFISAIHQAFEYHIPFTFSPEVIWTVIAQEVAQYVKDHSDEPAIAKLFTTTPGEKQEIIVEVHHYTYDGPNDWLQGIELFRKQLLKRVPSEIMTHMTPALSTETEVSKVTHLIAFMDAASKYYSYGMMTCCGIPSYRIDGTADDWQALIDSIDYLKREIRGLFVYFEAVTKVLKIIRDTVDGGPIDSDFWNSSYKIGGGSGGPYSNGWVNEFYAHTYGWGIHLKGDKQFGNYHRMAFGPKLNDYPANASNVPFTWYYYGKEIPMGILGGVLGSELDAEGYLTPKLGVSVIEGPGTKSTDKTETDYNAL